jgi:hypothetical protein
MKEQNYNIENLGNTYYLFLKDNKHMINNIKMFSLKYREKIAVDLGLSEEQAGFMQKIIDNKIWADTTYTYNEWKNKNMPNNFLDYFLSWNILESNLKYKDRLTQSFLESQNLITNADDLKQYFIISKTQLKYMLGGKGLVGAIKKEMKNKPLNLNIFDLTDRFAKKLITEEQYKYFQKVEQNLFSLINHEEFFFTIIKNRVGKADETQFLKMVDLAKQTKFPEASKFGNRTGFHKDLWKPTGNRNFF